MVDQINGELITGVGRGAKFIALSIYNEIFKQLLQNPPFLGTLNLKISESDGLQVEDQFKNGKVYDNLIYENKSYGGIITKKVIIEKNDESLNCIGVKPLRTTHDSTILEIVSDVNIRATWKISDGHSVTVSFED